MEDIVKFKLVRKKNGKTPSVGAISEAAKSYQQGKAKPGRKLGWRKTSKADDKVILKTFRRVRPPGHGVTARKVHKALPKKVRKLVCKRTVINRLAERGTDP